MIGDTEGAAQLLGAGRDAYAAGDMERSIQLLQDARLAGARDLDGLHLLGVACGKTGRYDDAREAISEALRLEFGLPAYDDAATAAALVELLWAQPSERWCHRLHAIERLGWVYSRTGRYEKWGHALIRSIAERNPAHLAPGNDEQTASATLRLLDFADNAPQGWVESVFSGVVWPWIRKALDADRYSLGLHLETRAYGAYVVKTESEAHFRQALSIWTDAMREAGRRAGQALVALPAPSPGPVPVVGFYLHSGGVLAHTQVLLQFLDAHANLDRPMIRPMVFVRGRAHRALAERLAASGTSYQELENQTGDAPGADLRALLLLRERVASEQVGALVWVSIAVHMAFAFSMRIAPVQIWWALKYHSLDFPEIDGYLTGAGAGSTKVVSGRSWRCAPLASDDWYRPQLASRAAEVRAQYSQHRVLFGCMGRESKLNSERFLESVAQVLKACPDAGFLWTGRERSSVVQGMLERFDVAERCHFIGWVDTKLYAQVLDVFLDSFPFPCGFTLYETMAAAKPVVVFASAEADETGLYALVNPLLSGTAGTAQEIQTARRIFKQGKLFHCARDPAQYVQFAIKLANDADARRAAGIASQAFVQAFLSDRTHMARTVARHLVELAQTAA